MTYSPYGPGVVLERLGEVDLGGERQRGALERADAPVQDLLGRVELGVAAGAVANVDRRGHLGERDADGEGAGRSSPPR